MKDVLDAQYSPAPAQGLMQKLLTNQHRRLIAAFAAFREEGARPDTGADTLLDVVLAAPPELARPSILMTHASPQERQRTTSFVVPADEVLSSRSSDARHLPGRHLPFEEGAFDWVFCGEMLQACGSFDRQYELLAELCRIARKGAFVTTPNRWHPLDLDTGLPFLHWLPPKAATGPVPLPHASHPAHPAGTSAVRHLQDRVGLRRLCALLPGRPAYDIGHLRIAGIKAHYFLLITKTPVAR